jgi:hypothetical protein
METRTLDEAVENGDDGANIQNDGVLKRAHAQDD